MPFVPDTSDMEGTGLQWRASTRADERAVRTALVAAGRLPRRETPAAPSPSEPAHPPWRSVVILVALSIAGVFVVLRGDAPPVAEPCRTITISVEPGAPEAVDLELARAAETIAAASGLRMARAENWRAADVIVWWADAGVAPRSPLAPVGGARHLATGGGAWDHTGPFARLSGGTINLDANVVWNVGLDRGDTLATALVHELGHVVGLGHSADPASFMFPDLRAERATWVDADRAALRTIGRRAGCTVEPS